MVGSQSTVTKTTNIIEINGQRYDVATGAVAIPYLGKQSHGRSMDGMIGGAKTSTTSPRPIKTTKPTTQPAATKAPPVIDIRTSASKHTTRHSPQTAKTLRRDSVSKPAPGHHFKAKHPSNNALVKHAPYTPAFKTASHAVNPDRAVRASLVPKSEQVRRFSGATAVQAAPKHLVIPSAPALAHTTPASKADRSSMDIFERALMMATSHEQPVLKAKRRHRRHTRILRYASTSLAVIILGGFIAWQNVAIFKIHMASSKAGFSATLPGYRPSGFALGKLSYSAGNVALNFHSNSDDRHYAVTEKTSDWDSQTLRDSFVSSASKDQYQTVQAGGRTIYVYGDNDATWVNGGVWYQVSSNGALNSRQLVSIATSM